METTVEIKEVNKTDQFEGTVTFVINDREYDAFFWGTDFKPGEKVKVELTQLEYPLDWEIIFNENIEKTFKIIQSNYNNWTYNCYGKIISINPIIADFGDLKLEIGNWTNDNNVIGEYIYWTIDRLEIKRTGS